MKMRRIIAIVKKDLLEVLPNKGAWLPMIIVPLIFVVIMPLAFLLQPATRS